MMHGRSTATPGGRHGIISWTAEGSMQVLGDSFLDCGRCGILSWTPFHGGGGGGGSGGGGATILVYTACA